MFILKHLKTLQHVSIIIQIIFRELVCSLLKSLILKFVKNIKKSIRWCGSITFGVCACVLCGEDALMRTPRRPVVKEMTPPPT